MDQNTIDPVDSASYLAFQQKCSSYGIEISDDQCRGLFDYLKMLLIKNESLNLTAIREWDDAIVLHLLDSLLFLKAFDTVYPTLQTYPFLDMGTGGGLPGIPLAIMRPGRTGVLCDSTKKKINAVDEFIDSLQLQQQLSTSSERLEILGKKQKRTYGCVVARAVASIPILIEYATPLLEHDGFLIISKGRPSTEEMTAGDKAARICGLQLKQETTYELPDDYGERRILVYEKTRESKIALPRNVGMAAKQPLA